MADPQTIEEWLRLAVQHELAAKELCGNPAAASMGHHHAGFVVECCLKAYIMHRERLNSWPSIAARRELYTHDLRRLAAIADITMSPLDELAPAWHVVLEWDRNQAYDPAHMPPKVAWAMYQAACGEKGVATWLRSILTPLI